MTTITAGEVKLLLDPESATDNVTDILQFVVLAADHSVLVGWGWTAEEAELAAAHYDGETTGPILVQEDWQ